MTVARDRRPTVLDDLRALIRIPSMPIGQVEDCARVLAAWVRRELVV